MLSVALVLRARSRVRSLERRARCCVWAAVVPGVSTPCAEVGAAKAKAPASSRVRAAAGRVRGVEAVSLTVMRSPREPRKRAATLQLGFSKGQVPYQSRSGTEPAKRRPKPGDLRLTGSGESRNWPQ